MYSHGPPDVPLGVDARSCGLAGRLIHIRKHDFVLFTPFDVDMDPSLSWMTEKTRACRPLYSILYAGLAVVKPQQAD